MNERIIRTFISVTLPKEIVSLSDMLKTTIITKKDIIKWVNPGNIHLTLKFLGNTPFEKIDEINKILNKLVENYIEIKLHLDSTGCFPAVNRPRILWLGINGELVELQKFVLELNSSLEDIGFPIEVEEFIPHITLGRIKYPQDNIPDISNFINTSFHPLKFNINRVRFMSSELFPNGPIYSILGTHYFGKNSQ